MEQAAMMSGQAPSELSTLTSLRIERDLRKNTARHSHPMVMKITTEIEANLRMINKLMQANEVLAASRDSFREEAERIFDEENPFHEEETRVKEIREGEFKKAQDEFSKYLIKIPKQ